MSLPSEETGWSGTPDDVYRLLRMNSTVFDQEVKFSQQILQNYYDSNPYKAVICHNDLHRGNIMYNKEGKFDPDQLILVDYDNAAYGFRAWDLLYNIANWEVSYTQNNLDQYLQGQ